MTVAEFVRLVQLAVTARPDLSTDELLLSRGLIKFNAVGSFMPTPEGRKAIDEVLTFAERYINENHPEKTGLTTDRAIFEAMKQLWMFASSSANGLAPDLTGVNGAVLRLKGFVA